MDLCRTDVIEQMRHEDQTSVLELISRRRSHPGEMPPATSTNIESGTTQQEPSILESKAPAGISDQTLSRF
ncbi:hypothetical protein AMJ82_11140 [candidate division TA06 bacterium SM23_40]|uniref:Uncharacterized protein n=1 Tax=candidate division TA06 bacterium SM23_40 TaxID=1703774 RepID=A0A0S8G3M3_UNCT6|nr:MAG: hypothetical protein AMJ82_11140 [candidate division TA06 bacterium SM23_40]